MKKDENKILPKLDVTNINISFKEISNEINQISGGMTGLRIEFINTMGGNLISEKNKRFMILRDSIQYRLNSILFRFKFLLDVQQRFKNRIDQDPFNNEKSHEHLFLGSEQQYALFDSIIFNIVSIFDYLACFGFYEN